MDPERGKKLGKKLLNAIEAKGGGSAQRVLKPEDREPTLWGENSTSLIRGDRKFRGSTPLYHGFLEEIIRNDQGTQNCHTLEMSRPEGKGKEAKNWRGL